jgi:hypothetical protein
MPNYYVRPDGSNANAGTGQAAGQAWQTVQYALTNATLGAGVNTIYIAPGIYRETVTINITPSVTNTLVIEGDPTCQQFSGITPGIVRLTNMASDTGAYSTASAITGVSKTYTTIKKLCIEGTITFSGSSNNLTITQCQLAIMPAGAQPWVDLAVNGNVTISNCIEHCLVTTSGGTAGGNNFALTNNAQVSFFDNVVMPMLSNGFAILSATTGCNANVYNCTFAGYFNFGVYARPTSTGCVTVRNCIIAGRGASAALDSSPGGGIVEDYNRILYSGTLRSGPSAGANTVTTGALGLDYGYSYLVGLSPQAFLGRMLVSPNAGFGNTSGAPLADLYGVTWPANPDAGAVTYNLINTVGPYVPAERNASAITIAPASTSQSIELYLGATGLTFATSGLAAYYVRNQSAPVAITLVTQTATGAWTSGGFAEISSSLVPGVYRLDVPDAAFAAGASDVTIVVRGASGTNGAVLTVTLSSGGLTAAQTAAAVWDEPYTSHVTASTFGARTLKTTVDNRPADVGTSFHIHANVHAIVDSAAAASELSGALLHNGTDYISADLLTPVSAATSVHIGPYQLLADGLGADQPLDVNVGTATSIDVQVTDANGTGIDITGATVTAKVYSSAGTLVASYAGTATYADNGRLTFGLTTTVTNTSGTYTVTVTRTTGATDTQIFGPLRLYVRPV